MTNCSTARLCDVAPGKRTGSAPQNSTRSPSAFDAAYDVGYDGKTIARGGNRQSPAAGPVLTGPNPIGRQSAQAMATTSARTTPLTSAMLIATGRRLPIIEERWVARESIARTVRRARG